MYTFWQPHKFQVEIINFSDSATNKILASLSFKVVSLGTSGLFPVLLLYLSPWRSCSEHLPLCICDVHWISFSMSKRQPFFSFFLFGEQGAGWLARLHTSQFRWFYQMFLLSTSGHNSKNLALTVLPCRMNFMMHNPLNVKKAPQKEMNTYNKHATRNSYSAFRLTASSIEDFFVKCDYEYAFRVILT